MGAMKKVEENMAVRYFVIVKKKQLIDMMEKGNWKRENVEKLTIDLPQNLVLARESMEKVQL